MRLSGEQARQIHRVLRLRPGDAIRVFDGSDREYQVTLETVTAESVAGHITAEHFPQTEPLCRLLLAVPLLKADKLEWVIQKGVELGVSGIVLTRTRRAVVQAGEERTLLRRDRYQRIACEAAEQSGRLKIPTLEGPLSWSEAMQWATSCALRLIAHPRSPLPLHRVVPAGSGAASAILFVGPEGGFTPEEISAAEGAGIQRVTLGARTLRAETAAVAGTAVLMALLEGAPATPAPGASAAEVR